VTVKYSINGELHETDVAPVVVVVADPRRLGDNVLVGDDPAKVTFEREGVYTDQKTGKPVAATTRYT
jgi:hypothetical protein